MARVYNFSGGPAIMPVPVLQRIRDGLMEYENCGMSVMEMSHRTPMFQRIIDAAEENLRKLMGIPANYKVLFIQGGATLQFSMIPMNLLKSGKAGYIISGNWAQLAYNEATKFGDIRILADGKDEGYRILPEVGKIDQDLDYVYICENETAYGLTYRKAPETGKVPLVSDQSSMFLSKPCNVSDYGLIYCGVQKNVGPSGMVIVIVREDLIRSDIDPKTPLYLRYDTHANNGSMYNTPNCWDIYCCGEVFKYLLEIGGLSEIERRNIRKADLLYNAIDRSSLFRGFADITDRSRMNVPFTTGDADLDEDFLADCTSQGPVNLKGHKCTGGIRASIYNAMPYEGVKKLVSVMHAFEKKHA